MGRFSENEQLKEIEESIPVLEKFLNYEQHSKVVWEQLARAYYFVGRNKSHRLSLLKSLEAIKHSESLESNSSTWNNMGLIVWELGDASSAKKYLSQSLKIALQARFNAAVPLHNLSAFLIEKKEYNEALSILERCLPVIEDHLDVDVLLDRIRLQHVVLLEACKERVRAIEVTKAYLNNPMKNNEVRLDFLIRMLYYFTTYSPDVDVIRTYENQVLDLINSRKDYREQTRIRAINNLAFSFLIFGFEERAQRYLHELSNYLHKDPFVTATFGLKSITKGELEKGTDLYKEAISLLSDKKAKHQFRQRMNFELGKFNISKNLRKQGLRFLDKALKERDGLSYVNNEILLLKNKLLRLEIEKK